MIRMDRTLLIVGGVTAVGSLVVVTGIDALLAPIRALSWRIAVLVVVPYTAVALLHTLAWRFLFARSAVSIGRLFSVRLAGEAFNEAATSVGGEPVKAYLLQPSVPFVEASAAVVVEKTAITVSQVLFLALGLAVALPLVDLSPGFLHTMVVLLGIQILAVVAFVQVQQIGVFTRALRLLERWGLPQRPSRMQGLIGLDRALVALYSERPGRVVACVLVHLSAWVAGSLEVYLVLQWLDVRASFADAFVIDAFGSAVKFMAFAIPGALGVLEGGYMVGFGALSFGAGLGLSFTLLRRLRMVVWSTLGLLALAWLRAAGPDVRQRIPGVS